MREASQSPDHTLLSTSAATIHMILYMYHYFYGIHDTLQCHYDGTMIKFFNQPYIANHDLK